MQPCIAIAGGPTQTETLLERAVRRELARLDQRQSEQDHPQADTPAFRRPQHPDRPARHAPAAAT